MLRIQGAGFLLQLRHEDMKLKAPALGVENIARIGINVNIQEIYDEVFGLGGVHHGRAPATRQRRLHDKDEWVWGYSTPREDHRGRDSGGFWIALDDGRPPLCADRCHVSEVQIRASPLGDSDYEEIRVRVLNRGSTGEGGKPVREMEAVFLKTYGSCTAYALAESGAIGLLQERLGAQMLGAPQLNATRFDGAVPVHAAACAGHGAVLQVLLAARADPNASYAGSPPNSKVTCFHDVLLQPKGPELPTDRSPREGRVSSRQWTPVLMATSRGHLEALRVLLAGRADANGAAGARETPLGSAAAGNQADAVKLLLDARAEPNRVHGSGGLTPLCIALSGSNAGIAKSLLQCRADPSEGLPENLLAKLAKLTAGPARMKLSYRILPSGALPPPPLASKHATLCVVSTRLEVQKVFDDSCPEDVICWSFSVPSQDPDGVQTSVLKELAKLRPSGFVFVDTDIEALPAVGADAGVYAPSAAPSGGTVGPLTRLYQASSVIEDFFLCGPERRGSKNALHRRVVSLARSAAEAKRGRLEAVAARHPGALVLHSDAVKVVPKDLTKMRQHGLELLQRVGEGAEAAAFSSLCGCCSGEANLRLRDVMILGRLLRRLPVSEVLPLLDLARRVLPLPTLGGSEPSAAEELLDAALQRGLDAEAGLKLHRLSISCLANALSHRNLREGLLPTAGQVVHSKWWDFSWRLGGAQAREAAAAVLLNCSLALQDAIFEGERPGLLERAVQALADEPQNEKLNLAVGNLIALRGSAEEAKSVLRAQPLSPLRKLAAAALPSSLAALSNG